MERIRYAASDNRNFGMVHREGAFTAGIYASYTGFRISLYVLCYVATLDRDSVYIQRASGAIDGVDVAVILTRNMYPSTRTGREDTQGQRINR